MLKIEIPGRKILNIENIIFDFNGTLALDGKLNDNTKTLLNKLKELVNIYILTADTYGTVLEQCKDLGFQVKIFSQKSSSLCKKKIVKSIKGDKIAVGNGFNDIEMFKVSELSIAIIGKEGCCSKLLKYCDIVVTSIEDVFDLFFNPSRIKATLRS